MDLGQAYAAARRHWILLLVLTLIGLSGGVANQLLTSPTYRSTVTVFFSLSRGGTVSELNDGNNYVQDLVPSYAKVATMPIVLSPVISDLGLDTTPGRLAGQVKVTLQPSSVVAQIAAEDSDPNAAADLANGVAKRLSQAMTTLSPRSSASTAVITVSTLSSATPSAFPVSPNRNINLGGGLLLGLICGFIAVAVRESIVTQPLTTRAEIERVTDTPVIGSIVIDQRAGNRPLPVSSHPTIARSESFRILQTTLGGLRGEGAQSFVVLSSMPAEGRSGIAVNLAIAMAHASRRVLLIDADLRKPSISQLLGIDNARGLTSVLNATFPLESSIQTWVTQPWGQRSLDVLPSGPLAANPSELLASRAMSWVLEEVRKNYDVVVVDSPPLLQSTDGALLSAQLDYAIMVVDSPRTKQRHLVESLSRLRMAGADVIGLVLNRTAPSSQLEYPAMQTAVPRGPEVTRHTAGHAIGRGASVDLTPAAGTPQPKPTARKTPSASGFTPAPGTAAPPRRSADDPFPPSRAPKAPPKTPQNSPQKAPQNSPPPARGQSAGGQSAPKPGGQMAPPPKRPVATDKSSPRQPPAQGSGKKGRQGDPPPPPTVELPVHRPPAK